MCAIGKEYLQLAVRMERHSEAETKGAVVFTVM